MFELLLGDPSPFCIYSITAVIEKTLGQIIYLSVFYSPRDSCRVRLICISIGFRFSFQEYNRNMTDYLSLCLICKDENHYLHEWLDYHILAGVQRFYVYDNDSKIPVRETLAEYIQKGWVVVMEIHGRPKQLNAYDHCITVFGKQSRWVGFIDTDEYLVPKQTTDLKDVLKDYEEFGGLLVSSFFFGSNGHKSPPTGGQMVSYRMRADEAFTENKLVKSIVQPEKILFAHTPHDFIYHQGAIGVNEEKKYVDNQRFPHRSSLIQLNHYYCRSLDEIHQKMSRGRGDTNDGWKRNRFDATNRMSVYEDTSILDLLKQIIDLRDPQAWRSDFLDPNNCGLLETIHRLALSCIAPPPIAVDIPNEVIDRPEFEEWLGMKEEITKWMNVKDHRRAREALGKMHERIPDRVMILNDIARASFPLGEFDVAWQFIARAWSLAPGAFSVLEIMTAYYRVTHQVEMAEKTARLRLDIAPRDVAALADLTLVLFDQGRWEDALKVGLPIVEINWITRELYSTVGIELVVQIAGALHRTGNSKKAIDILKIAIEKLEKNSHVYVKLAQIYLAQKNKFDARHALREAEKINPNDPDLIATKKALA
jgi:tetratricopeptide (TPR) repeat protein